MTTKQKQRRSKFGFLDKNGDEIWVTREEFMAVYRKMIKEWTEKHKK